MRYRVEVYDNDDLIVVKYFDTHQEAYNYACDMTDVAMFEYAEVWDREKLKTTDKITNIEYAGE